MEGRFQELCKKWVDRWPEQVGLIIGFDQELAHQIEAGSDIFLMPSFYEPCGLNQLYSLRYGSIPIVHATGGLRDTVIDISKDPKKGTGFLFTPCQKKPLLNAMKKCIKCYAKPKIWQKLQIRGMNQDFSWNRSAKEYSKLYKSLLSP